MSADETCGHFYRNLVIQLVAHVIIHDDRPNRRAMLFLRTTLTRPTKGIQGTRAIFGPNRTVSVSEPLISSTCRSNSLSRLTGNFVGRIRNQKRDNCEPKATEQRKLDTSMLRGLVAVSFRRLFRPLSE